ncbi:MAG: response regulator transcription factor [Bacteroidota bacterium]|nr:response regulator transcription factor [Bacteroidota bacterium]MDP4216585.1 response regulator transcription factor [Bacteroidota bacterium]MDP4245882.1 response regulator transcription factor [Bacteroidota bacterium]MDP4256621.1 response regulator transcription factor [Bacteroidota bacterium]
MIKLLIIDDHPLIIDGIRTMLKDTGYVEIAGACKTAREGLAFIVDHPETEIILLDINLPDMDGLRACELIRQINKQVKIIGLTYVNEAGIITQLIRKGANGYLLKNMEREEFIDAIDRVLNGELYLSKGANEKILQQLQAFDLPGNKVPVLTRREVEILQLLGKGLTSQEIAGRLFLSVYTIDTHRKNMLQKFNVHNTQALLNAVQELKILG